MSPGGNKRARPPLGRMLERILPAEWRQDIAGDLEADWRRRRTGAGRARAALWYLRQLAGYLLRWRQIRKLAHVSAPAHSQRRRSKESWMHSLLQDVRLAARSLKRNPGLALVVIVTLALGIGANTAIFSLTDEVLLRSLPVADPERLVAVEGQRADGRVSISYPLFTELQEQQTVLTGLMADAGAGLERVELEGQKLSGVRVSSVSGNYFEVLGVRPYLGRMLSAEDDQPGGEGGAAVVSYAFWTGRLGGQSDALGRVLRVGGSHFTIAGVAPPEFFGAQVGSRTDVWLPMRRSMSEDSLTWRTGTFFRIMGRLGSGVTPQQAEQELSALFRHRLEAEAAQGETIVRQGTRIADHRILLKPAANGFDRLRQSYSLPLKVLTAATLLALLIVCFNVANLMLARAAARGRELATRLALGAGRLRLARQMMMESLLLGLVGGLAGLVTAWAASPFIAGFIASPQDASLLHLRPDGRILGYALAASLATGLLFGLAPVCWCLLRDPGRALGGGREGSDSGRPRLRLAKVMMAAQLTISLLLLSGAGLMLGTLQELAGVSLGFQQERLAVASVHFEVPRERRTELTRAIEERLAAEPGVRSASASWLGLFTRSNMSANLDIAGYQAGADEEVSVRVNSVSPAYLDTLGIPLLAGRPLRASDDEGAPKAALVNRAFVQRYLPGQSALGRTFRLKGDDADVEIVGVTGDFLWNDLRARPEPIFLLSSAQWGMSTRSIQIRLQVPFQSAAASLRKAIEDLDETALVVRLESMSNQVDTTIRQERMLAHLAAWFSGLGTLLACLGLYGILSYSVQRRRREIGIRLAVGARRSAILGLVLREALLLLLVALPLGLAGSWLASQAISSFLFGVEPHDPRILTGVAALLALVTLLAALLPARRAAALDPAHILRE